MPLTPTPLGLTKFATGEPGWQGGMNANMDLIDAFLSLIRGTGAIRSVSGNTVLTSSDNIVLVDASGGTVTITLPAAASNKGLGFIVKKTDSSINRVIVDGNSTELIDLAQTYTLHRQNDFVAVISGGTQMHIIAASSPGASGFVTGRYYPIDSTNADTTLVQVLNQVDYCRFTVQQPTPFDRIAIEVTTLAATALIRLGIYGDTGKHQPGGRIIDAGTVSGATGGAKEIVIAETLGPGIYWLAAVAQTAAPTVRGRATVPYSGQLGEAAVGNTNMSHWIETGVTGALPATATPVQAQTTLPKVYLRAA